MYIDTIITDFLFSTLQSSQVYIDVQKNLSMSQLKHIFIEISSNVRHRETVGNEIKSFTDYSLSCDKLIITMHPETYQTMLNVNLCYSKRYTGCT